MELLPKPLPYLIIVEYVLIYWPILSIRSPHKQGCFLPGNAKIPIYAPDKIKETKPNYVVILPWNLKDEVMDQMAYIREWGGKFVTTIPKVTVHSWPSPQRFSILAQGINL